MKREEQGQGEVAGAGAAVRAARSTQVRTRCKGRRTKEEEVEAQVLRALPQIVKANVAKAKGGSLVHTRWLWGVVEKASPQDGDEAAAKESLAQMLLEQLGEL